VIIEKKVAYRLRIQNATPHAKMKTARRCNGEIKNPTSFEAMK